jgi:N-dimethylarginine dimethylaminohydrolase
MESEKQRDAAYVYEQTIKMFGAQAEPSFETPSEQTAVWGRPWGCNNDVGRLRAVLMHRPGAEMSIVDPGKRIESIGSFGDPESGWYWQSETVPPLAEMQGQHDALARALRDEGVEVFSLEGVDGGRLKSCYTRDSAIALEGGAVVTRLGPKIRRGEELTVTRTLAKLGVPILRTIHGSGLLEGGSFAWINSRTAVVGRSIRVNEEGARQLEDVLRTRGVELLRVDLCGYDLHIDGSFVMIDVDKALVRAESLPFWFLEKLKELGVRTVETTPDDEDWIINCLAVRPGRVLMPEGASSQTLDRLAKLHVEVVVVPYDRMALNGGGIHCSTCPLARDPVD